MLKKIIIIIIIALLAVLFYWRGLNAPANRAGEGEQPFLVSKGESVGQVAENLKKENLIDSVFYFKYYLWRHGLNIKAGEYLLSSKLTVREIVKLLSAGQTLSQEKAIKIIEGWNIRDINDYFNQNKILPADSFIGLAAKAAEDLRPEIGGGLAGELPPGATLEGFLFPDTYRVFKDATAAEIIKKMLDNFNKKVTPETREEIKRQKKTLYEIITLASIVEKEVRTPADMKIVAGLFWDRIKNGQGLESCATLAYVLGVNKAQYSLEDTKINSPYNTYKYRGLPPGPIANPGLNAIKAAIYPEVTAYNYFLSDPATGRTIYSRTLDEHNRNKAKYLK